MGAIRIHARILVHEREGHQVDVVDAGAAGVFRDERADQDAVLAADAVAQDAPEDRAEHGADIQDAVFILFVLGGRFWKAKTSEMKRLKK
jgi:hypothetical protein